MLFSYILDFVKTFTEIWVARRSLVPFHTAAQYILRCPWGFKQLLKLRFGGLKTHEWLLWCIAVTIQVSNIVPCGQR